MRLRSGIPTISEVEALQRDPIYQGHLEFNRRFLETHGRAIRRYGRHWGADPFKLWSRRWEYPFAAEAVFEFAAAESGGELQVLDAGSGVTYFPYFLCEHLPGAEVSCCDSDGSYAPMFQEINRTDSRPRVRFLQSVLQSMPLADRSIDVICCISVLEHTDNYVEIVREFRRVLRPGGLLVLTFDLSLDGRFALSRDSAAELLGQIERQFELPDRMDCGQELGRMSQSDVILSTDHVRRTQPQLLPWRHPLLKAAHDLIEGHGWTGGFRSKSIFCIHARAAGAVAAAGAG